MIIIVSWFCEINLNIPLSTRYYVFKNYDTYYVKRARNNYIEDWTQIHDNIAKRKRAQIIIKKSRR